MAYCTRVCVFYPGEEGRYTIQVGDGCSIGGGGGVVDTSSQTVDNPPPHGGVYVYSRQYISEVTYGLTTIYPPGPS